MASRRSPTTCARAPGLLGNPAYVPLGVRGLYIGEYVGEGDVLWPGEVLGYLAQLESGGARGAGRERPRADAGHR